MSNIPLIVPVVEAGIDWVSCSAERPMMSAALLALGRDLVQQEAMSGATLTPYYNHGYAGYKAGGAAYGNCPRGTIVSVSGATARESASELLRCSDNVSRLDVQVTVRSDECGAEYAKRVYGRLVGEPRGRGRPIAHTLITSDWTGDTLNIGRRVSDNFGRIYNKSAEEKVLEVPLRWRWEIELKRKPAQKAAWAYTSASDKSHWSLGEVFDWFERRHCAPPISKVLRVGVDRSSRGSHAQANRIKWLKLGVRPVVVRLAAEFGWPDVLALLGVPMRYSDAYVNETMASMADLDGAGEC